MELNKLFFERSIVSLMGNKGLLASVSEKSFNNCKSKNSNIYSIYYFTIEHAFKQINKYLIFKGEENESLQKTIYRDFTALQFENFKKLFDNTELSCSLFELLASIRNISSHYLHTLEPLKLDNIHADLIRFIRESFKLALVQSYLNEEVDSTKDEDKIKELLEKEDQIVLFLKGLFYQSDYNNSKSKAESDSNRDEIDYINSACSSLDSAIDFIVFKENPEDLPWQLNLNGDERLNNHKHELLVISKGKYLSFEACVFILSMFLYRNEANCLIPRLKGFKKNEKAVDQAKLKTFLFFTKKFSSQDINSEYKALVNFRDIFQYLNKFPQPWNQALEGGDKLENFKNELYTSEIKRIFPKENEDFLEYAKSNIFFNFYDKKSPFNYKVKSNDDVKKLKKRISDGLFFNSYARNSNRFLEFGARFLAENKYFGEAAEFKMYKYYFRQNEQDVQNNISTKEADSLKFKDGRETHFSTYQAKLAEYPEWDLPFVIENNAFYVKLKYSESQFFTKKTFCIHSDLLVYLLEHALQNTKIGAGYIWLAPYYSQLVEEKKASLETLSSNSSITLEDKTRYKKLVPRRLLNMYCTGNAEESDPKKGFKRILEEAGKSEVRFLKLATEAQANKDREKLFKEKNKGKNFKLTFVRKACHLMYFKSTYLSQAIIGHHKSFHITRTEFNDFCKWMYAFNDVPVYKTYLYKLFDKKGFFMNSNFKELFENSQSLEDLYAVVKKKFRKWLEKAPVETQEHRFTLPNYEILSTGNVHINVNHFKHAKIKDFPKFETLENRNYLIKEYYAPSDNKSFSRKINKVRHHDCILYEIGLRYLHPEEDVRKKAKTNVKSILQNKILIKCADYEVNVPIKDIEKLISLRDFDIEKERKGFGFLNKIPQYLEKTAQDKAIKEIASSFNKNKVLELSDLSKINNHIINNQAKFIACLLTIESFLIWKHKLNLKKGENFLGVSKIINIKNYAEISDRNTAFHFNIPQEGSYRNAFNKLEFEFKKELNSITSSSFTDLPKPYQQVIEVFLRNMRNDIYDKSKIYKDSNPNNKETLKRALESYYNMLGLKK